MASHVEVDDRRIIKPFLGGWRNKVSNIEYLNAESQTGPPPWRLVQEGKCSRLMQSVVIKDANTQSPYDRSTQMWRPDCFISSENDKYLTTKPYETYEEMQLRLDPDGKARIIQRNYRAYRLWKYIRECARKYREMIEDCKKYEAEKLVLYRKRHQVEILRKMHPKSRGDFDMLYELIDKWKRDHFRSTELSFFMAARCAESYSILEKSVEMLNVIDEKRRAVQDRHRKRKNMRFLTINCKPIRWNGYKGKMVEMITMKVQRARELKCIYESLESPDATREERMELLIMLKRSLERHNCVAALNLIRLLDQELTFLERELEKLPLDCFRKRSCCFLKNTDNYLRFLRASNDCECENENKESCQKVEDEKLREAPESRTRLCKSCTKLLPHHRFSVHGRMKKLSTCIGCTWLRERNSAHINYNPYIFLLNCVRAEERRRHCSSAIAFMMQKRDMYHLVNTIWHGYSVVSKNNDLFALRLIRYHVDVEWSPWNCILLTEDEANIHWRIKDLKSVYSVHLIDQISLAHQIAKNHFKRLVMFDKDFRESSRYYKIQDRIDYKPAIKVEDYYLG